VRRLRVLICCIALLGGRHALSAELSIGGDVAGLQTVISGVAFPSRLAQDLKSGLTNRILIRLELLRDSQVEARTDVLVTVRYDLWEEVYLVTEATGALTVTKQEFSNPDKVMEFLSRIVVPDVFGIAKRSRIGSYLLRAQILLNPIDRERLDNLRKWVAENAGAVGSVSAGAEGGLGEGVTAPAGAPAPNSLFSRIFRGYSGIETAAKWRETVESKPFTVNEIIHDRE
jgi:hypothetical protein